MKLSKATSIAPESFVRKRTNKTRVFKDCLFCSSHIRARFSFSFEDDAYSLSPRKTLFRL